MLQPADLLLLDEPTNDLDIRRSKSSKTALRSSRAAVVLVSHDRELMDQLCTEVVGLDGMAALRSTAASVSGSRLTNRPWLCPGPSGCEIPTTNPNDDSHTEARKLSYHEQQEWEQMEVAILTAEEVLAERHAEVERVAGAGHSFWQMRAELEDAQKEVERLYARWQELEAKRRH